MKLKKPAAIILIAILVVFSLLGLYISHIDQVKKLMTSFLSSVVALDDNVYEHYIHPHFEGSLALIDFITSNRYDIQYEVLSARRINLKEYKISVELQYNGHSIPLDFMVLKDNRKWLISHMPEYSYIPAALFLEYDDLKDQSLKFDVRGTTLSYSAACSLSLEKWTPISLHIIDDCIFDYEILKKSYISRVMRYDSNFIEDMHVGDIRVATDMPIYTREIDGFVLSKDNFIPIGTEDVYICSDADDVVQLAIYDRQAFKDDRIRVLINNSTHESKIHEELDILCDSPYVARYIDADNSLEFKFKKGEKITFRLSDDGIELHNHGKLIAVAPNRWYIENNDKGHIYIENIEREFTRSSSKGTPYRGNFEISDGKDGLILINELPIEEYLYSVVTSEMPISFGPEALKVQAIAARAYAVASLYRPGFASYGAHLDDSTASQMYNNTIEHPTALKAVQSTEGLVPLYEGEIVDTRFFSTSPGYTAAYSEVWSDSDGSFPSTEIPYLLAKPQYTGDSPGLHNDENFRAFIDNVNTTSYDRFSPLFRWSVEFSRSELEASINENLSVVQTQQPQFVLTRVGDDYEENTPIPEDIGELLNIVVVERGHGGNIMELELSTTSGTYRIIKELNIRNVLRPIDYMGDSPIELKCYDDSIKENFPLLPSTFAYIDMTRDGDGHITNVTITGGGYGHGVGMSQYGTYGLTLLGKNYIEIVEHYYTDSELEKIY